MIFPGPVARAEHGRRDDQGATVEDVSGVQQVVRAGWAAAYGDILRTETIERAMEEWYATESVSGQIEREHVGYFVAEEGYEAVSFEVLVGNEVGASFYRKHGYSADVRRESDLFDEPVEAYLFSGELD